MDEQPARRGGPLYWLERRPSWFWIVVIALLPVSYVASFGPLWWLGKHGYLPDWVIGLPIYAPLQWLRFHGPQPLRDVVDWYIKFCARLF